MNFERITVGGRKKAKKNLTISKKKSKFAPRIVAVK
jgi:hypothetical protein